MQTPRRPNHRTRLDERKTIDAQLSIATTHDPQISVSKKPRVKNERAGHSLGYALDTTRTTHDASTAVYDDGFGAVTDNTVHGYGIVMIAPTIEVAIASTIFFIDRSFLALDGGEGCIAVHRGVAETERSTLGRDGGRGGGRRAREGGGRREGRWAGV